MTTNDKLLVLYDDLVSEELFLAVLNVATERLDLFVVQHEAHTPASHDLLLADAGGGQAARPAPLGAPRVGVVAHLEQSDGRHELVDVTGAAVPQPEEPLGRLPDTFHVEQIPAHTDNVNTQKLVCGGVVCCEGVVSCDVVVGFTRNISCKL